MKQTRSMAKRLQRCAYIVVGACLMAPALANAQSTDLFSDATTSITDMGTKYTALLKLLFTTLVVAGIIFALVKRGSKKASGS